MQSSKCRNPIRVDIYIYMYIYIHHQVYSVYKYTYKQFVLGWCPSLQEDYEVNVIYFVQLYSVNHSQYICF